MLKFLIIFLIIEDLTQNIMSPQTELLWDWLILKNRKNIGTIKPHMVRTYSKPVIQEISTPAAKTSSQPTHSAPTPEYCVLQVHTHT